MELEAFSPQEECPGAPSNKETIPKISSRKRSAAKCASIQCLICGANRSPNELRNVRIWSDKLLVLMASLNRQEIDVALASHLSASPVVFYVCCTHLINTCEELFSMLDAKSPFDIPNSDQALVAKAMQTMDSFKTGLECLPIVSSWHFLQICYSFLVKHWHDVAKVPLPVNASVKYIYPRKPAAAAALNRKKYRCRICDEVKHPQSVKLLKNRIEKLLVLIAAVNSNTITFASASHLFSLSTILTCRNHLADACSHLMMFLKVTAPRMISKADRKEVTSLMLVIHRISEGIEVISERDFLQHSMDVCQQHWTGLTKKKQIEVVPSPNCPDKPYGIVGSEDIKVEHEEVVESIDVKDAKRKKTKKGENESDSSFPQQFALHPTCRICEKRNDSVQFVTFRADKLFLLLVSMHRKEISKETAQSCFQLPTLFICHHHFIDSSRDLFAMLGVSCPDDFPENGTKKEITETLELANFIRGTKSPLTEQLFVQLCRQFWEKHGGEKADKKTDEPVKSCRLCGTIRRESDVRSVTVLSEKMIVLVTAVSGGGMSKSLARQYFNQKKELLVCQWHLVDVCKKLCTMFRVARPEAFTNPTKHLVDHAMELVGDIQKGRFPFATTDGKHFVQQCQRFTNKYWKPKKSNDN